ncbi:MAG: molybdopterin molybdotransferase MoeA [Pseudomonadota bacterium]
MISVDEALALIGANRLPNGTERCKVSEAAGRTLAASIVAPLSRPGENVSAMDGYAVKLGDVGTPGARLTVIGEAPAGQPFEGELQAGQTVRIFTGGVVPGGADHIVIQEDIERDGQDIICREAYSKQRHIRTAGLDFKRGQTLLQTGAYLTPAHIGLIASANIGEIEVARRPSVGLIASGNELKPPGSTLKPGDVVNSNASAIAALVDAWGGQAANLGIAEDSPAAIREKIDGASDMDILVPVGGASVGDHDHMQATFSAAGFEPVFSKIAVKPGKPTWFGKRGGQRVLGLPGNPASALVCAHLFLSHLIMGKQAYNTCTAVLDTDLAANGPRETYLRAGATFDPDGQLHVLPADNQDSSLLSPFITSNCLIRRTPDALAAATGSRISILPIGPLTVG